MTCSFLTFFIVSSVNAISRFCFSLIQFLQWIFVKYFWIFVKAKRDIENLHIDEKFIKVSIYFCPAFDQDRSMYFLCSCPSRHIPNRIVAAFIMYRIHPTPREILSLHLTHTRSIYKNSII